MNYKTQSWWDRFSTQVMTIDGEDDNSGGGGDISVDAGGDDTGDQGSGGVDDEPQIDLNSEDPLVIQKFPSDHKLNAAQIKALMGFTGKEKKVEEPEVKPTKEAKKPELKIDPKTGKPTKVDPKAPVYDPVAKRWRDPVTKKLVAAPKGAKPPAPDPKAVQQPPAKTGPDKIDKLAGVVEKLVEGATKPPGKDGDKGPPPFFGEGGARPALSAPDELMAMLDHEDPAQRKTAVGYMMTGVANMVMKEMFGAMQYMRENIMKEVPKMVAGTVVQDKNSSSFYERHSHLNKPLIQPVVDHLGTIVAAEFQNSGRQWRTAGGGFTEDFMDEVALRTEEELGISSNSSLQPESEPSNSAPRRKPFFNRSGSARPPAASRETEKSADIMGVVGYRGH